MHCIWSKYLDISLEDMLLVANVTWAGGKHHFYIKDGEIVEDDPTGQTGETYPFWAIDDELDMCGHQRSIREYLNRHRVTVIFNEETNLWNAIEITDDYKVKVMLYHDGPNVGKPIAIPLALHASDVANVITALHFIKREGAN